MIINVKTYSPSSTLSVSVVSERCVIESKPLDYEESLALARNALIAASKILYFYNLADFSDELLNLSDGLDNL